MLRFPSGSQQHNSTKRQQQTTSHHRQRDNTNPIIKHWWHRLRAKLTPHTSDFHGLSPDRPPLPSIEPDSPNSNDNKKSSAIISRQSIAVNTRRAGSSKVSLSTFLLSDSDIRDGNGCLCEIESSCVQWTRGGSKNHARGYYEIWRVAALSGITSSTFSLRVCLFVPMKGISTLF